MATTGSPESGVVLCPVCQGEAEAFSPYRGIDQDNPLLVKIFASKMVWQCRVCQHGFCHPPAEFDLLSKYYESDYWADISSTRKLVPLIKRLLPGIVGRRLMRSNALPPQIKGQVDLIVQQIEKQGGETWLKDQCLLEVGAGAASIAIALLRLYPRAGLNAHVVEPSDEFRYLYRWYGIKKVADTFEEMAECRRYPMILASHWLEHVVDLNETFAKICRLLAPSGLISLEVPNCDDVYWQYRFSPNPPHLHFFTTVSLPKMLERFGFRVNFLGTCGPPLEWEKFIGFLKTDTPALVSHAELKQLEQERHRKHALHLQSLDLETRAAVMAHGFRCTYSDQGRQYIQIVATLAP